MPLQIGRPPAQPCPSCGHCPTCGHTAVPAVPAPPLEVTVTGQRPFFPPPRYGAGGTYTVRDSTARVYN